MSRVVIFMEGGGDSRDQKDKLRQGMDSFLRELKEAARNKAWRWKLTCCGGRSQTFSKFQAARQRGGDAIVILLVDSETPVNSSPCAHLRDRDGWNLQDGAEDRVYLMAQVMETWIAADIDALRKYYGQKFLEKSIPKHPNLEEVSKQEIADSLESATHGTQKGVYHKIRHAKDLLERINPNIVRQKCRHCDRLFSTLGEIIAE